MNQAEKKQTRGGGWVGVGGGGWGVQIGIDFSND